MQTKLRYLRWCQHSSLLAVERETLNPIQFAWQNNTNWENLKSGRLYRKSITSSVSLKMVIFASLGGASSSHHQSMLGSGSPSPGPPSSPAPSLLTLSHSRILWSVSMLSFLFLTEKAFLE